jgi:hypothetical protein
VEKVGDLFRDSSTKLPANAGLYGKHDIVHFYLACAASIFCVDIRVGEDVCGVSVGKVKELVENGGLDVLDGGGGRKKESDGACGRRKIVWPRHEGVLLGTVY